MNRPRTDELGSTAQAPAHRIVHGASSVPSCPHSTLDQTRYARNKESARRRSATRKSFDGIDLTVNAGEVHAVMGPNGSGKSTLAQVLAGHPAYEVTEGTVPYDGQDLLEMEPEERAQAGVFLAFQYPVEIPGVSNAYFLRSAYNEIRKARGDGGSRSARVPRPHGGEAQARRHGRRDAQPLGEHGLLRRREEAQRDPADGGARADARDSRRDGLRARHRRAAHRRRRREQAAAARQRDDRRHALSAAAQLHRPRLRARARRRPDREIGRQGARARARGEGLRLGDWGAGARERSRTLARLRRRSRRRTAAAPAPAWLPRVRRAAIARFAALGFPTTKNEDWHFTSVAPIAEAEFQPLSARLAATCRPRDLAAVHCSARATGPRSSS